VGDRWIVRDLNFEIAGGELTALIGESGAGKTTIFHLLLRLVEPTCGVIWIDDAPLNDLAEADLRRLIGFIPQNPFIFNASLRDNLLVAATLPEQPEALLAEVAEAAQLEPLIRSRDGEGGLDSSAGYLGMRLSGGERQRIALGRLLVQDPRIIVCDEYTANIDVKTAQLIQEMMRTRFAGRTRLVITHELYNARGADRVLVLDQGRIVQLGTPRELLAVPGLYRTMWETQRLE
jgi:ATP-binding cassette subfamily B protein